MKIKVDAFQCERCSHIWLPHKREEAPGRCAKCKSPYWNTPRKEQAAPAKKGRRITIRPRPAPPAPVPKAKPSGKLEAVTKATAVAEMPTGVSRHCVAGAHAGCKGCGCGCHKA